MKCVLYIAMFWRSRPIGIIFKSEFSFSNFRWNSYLMKLAWSSIFVFRHGPLKICILMKMAWSSMYSDMALSRLFIFLIKLARSGFVYVQMNYLRFVIVLIMSVRSDMLCLRYWPYKCCIYMCWSRQHDVKWWLHSWVFTFDYSFFIYLIISLLYCRCYGKLSTQFKTD